MKFEENVQVTHRKAGQRKEKKLNQREKTGNRK